MRRQGNQNFPVCSNKQTLCHIITDKHQTNDQNTNIVCGFTGLEETHQLRTSLKWLMVAENILNNVQMFKSSDNMSLVLF